jgi:hypothetical protein
MTEAHRAARRLLDDIPAVGCTPRLQLLGFDVELRTPDAELGAFLTDLFGSVCSPEPGPPEHVLMLSSTASESGPRSWSVHLDAVRVISTPAPSVALHYLLWEANRQAIECTHDLVLVHASAVVLGSTAIVFPGPMGAGKSTLAASLVRAGLGYLTDEVVAIDPRTGVIRPYPKYLSVGGALSDLVPQSTPRLRPFLGDQSLVAPEAIRPGAVAAAAAPRVIVAPRYERGATTSLEPMRRAHALATLAEHAFHIERDGRPTLDTLARTVERSSCFTLVSGDVTDATDALLDLLDGVLEPVRS